MKVKWSALFSALSLQRLLLVLCVAFIGDNALKSGLQGAFSSRNTRSFCRYLVESIDGSCEDAGLVVLGRV